MVRAKLKHIEQPPLSSLCGQSCVGMILGLDLNDACKLIGHKHGTQTKELVKALGKLAAAKRLAITSKHNPIPEYAILRISFNYSYNWHWVIKWKNTIYDSGCSRPLSYKYWKKTILALEYGGNITSFLPLNFI